MIHWYWLIVAFVFGGVGVCWLDRIAVRIRQSAIEAVLERRDRRKSEAYADFYGKLLARSTYDPRSPSEYR